MVSGGFRAILKNFVWINLFGNWVPTGGRPKPAVNFSGIGIMPQVRQYAILKCNVHDLLRCRCDGNFAYVPSAEVDIVQVLLAGKRPWQGNRLQQAKPQLDALQQSIASQLASEKASATNWLDELSKRLQRPSQRQRSRPP